MFEAFWTTKDQGLGIGLPISQSILAAIDEGVPVSVLSGMVKRGNLNVPVIGAAKAEQLRSSSEN